MVLPVTLVLVSDFEPGDKTWQDEIVALDLFLNDRAGTPAQVVVMEGRSADGSTPPVPDAIAALAPRVEVHFVASDRSAALKDAALEHCRHALVAVVEADCRPETGWLAKLVDALDRDPHLDVASSPTVYPGESSIRRVLTVLDRGYLYQGRPGRRRISSNGAVFRREVLEAHPFPTDETNPFVSGHLQHDAMQRAGVRSELVASTRMIHAFGGRGFVSDQRRNKGFQAARIARRSHDGGRPSVVARAMMSRLRADRRSVRAAYQLLRPRDIPLLAVLFVAVRPWELIGAWRADDQHRFDEATAYR